MAQKTCILFTNLVDIRGLTAGKSSINYTNINKALGIFLVMPNLKENGEKKETYFLALRESFCYALQNKYKHWLN